ncbi:hypothetical protein MYCTH_2296064 [Thermothelomyces thermophilus ATCC 42464]|uniref:Uncharacterized protein n=1 Tax=Thermothelomyces thermophilus (strain ATCC 42464 / BCRC 31852 / DSM 1799) TaxID=573729 RepID=G2Q0F8_THET4|nr:uncharacterized protein MYCTH_2296064 [Thermothelomyces thermophilus ATCC 42464]AEO54019.1 hypothetical protein MYCTH_2296064 [Thermothelomyces thermophilus ATCC 42464]
MADNLPSGNEFRAGRAASTTSASSAGSWAGEQAQAQAQAKQADPKGKQQPFRRPSHSLFEGLTAQKRKDDPDLVARRQSLNEQREKPGFIGRMWDNWVRGEK